MTVVILKVCVTSLYLLMAVRAFQSGTTIDRLLGVYLLAGLVMLFTLAKSIATACLLAGAAAYLVSQVLTSARWVSRALPLLAAVLTVALYAVQ